MKTAITVLMLLACTRLSTAQTPCAPCEKLKDLKLPDVTILNVESKPNDNVRPAEPWMGPIAIAKPFCRVTGRISAEINFELYLPQEWNGRFIMSGGGGFVGAIHNGYRDQVNNGYATAGTDTGHSGPPFSAEWALNNMERQINFGRLAIHRTAVVSESIINSFYCKEAAYSYFIVKKRHTLISWAVHAVEDKLWSKRSFIPRILMGSSQVLQYIAGQQLEQSL